MDIRFSEAELRPLVEAVVKEVFKQTADQNQEPAGHLERMLCENEAASIFAVDVHVLRDARKRGELEYHRVGRFVRYERSQIQAFIERTKRAAANN